MKNAEALHRLFNHTLRGQAIDHGNYSRRLYVEPYRYSLYYWTNDKLNIETFVVFNGEGMFAYNPTNEGWYAHVMIDFREIAVLRGECELLEKLSEAFDIGCHDEETVGQYVNEIKRLAGKYDVIC